jgi:hypothetical protein
MKASDQLVKQLVAAVEHVLQGEGPASLTLTRAGLDQPEAVVFVIPAPVGPLVDTFLNDLYLMLGWGVQKG